MVLLLSEDSGARDFYPARMLLLQAPHLLHAEHTVSEGRG